MNEFESFSFEGVLLVLSSQCGGETQKKTRIFSKSACRNFLVCWCTNDLNDERLICIEGRLKE